MWVAGRAGAHECTLVPAVRPPTVRCASARAPQARPRRGAQVDVRRLCIHHGFELAQRTPVTAPVPRQVGRHHMGAQQQIADTQQAAVEAVLPGVGVLLLGGVVRGDPELRHLGDAVGVQHRLLARERQAHRPVHQHRLLGADVLLHRPQLGHPWRRHRHPVAQTQRLVLGDHPHQRRVGGDARAAGSADCATTEWDRGRRAPSGPPEPGHRRAPAARTPIRRPGRRCAR